MKTYKNCQSCGIPLNRDPKRGGTNSDGTISQKYCSHCYENGEFTLPNITAVQMQEHVKGKLKEMGVFMRMFASFFTKGIPKLERWKKN